MKYTINPSIKSLLLASFVVCPVLCFIITGCNKEKTHPVIAVSVEPQKTLLQEIAGDGYEIVALLKPGANPEGFEPTMATRMAVDNADILFVTGLLPFEQQITDGLPQSVTVSNLANGIELIYGTHGHHHGHHDGGKELHHHSDAEHGDVAEGHHHEHDDFQADPHIWTSVKNARVMAGTMYETLVRKFPQDSTKFRQNYNRTMAKLDSLDNVFASKLKTLPENSRAFAVWHPSLTYFARDYGLSQVSVGFENKEVSPRKLAEVTENVRNRGIKVFFFQSEYDGRQAETLNKTMGTTMISINPQNADWTAELTRVVDNLVKCAK